MIEPLHQHHLIIPTRCDPMMAQASRNWSVYKQIFADHWDGFKHAHPRYQTAYYDSLVAKMLEPVVRSDLAALTRGRLN